MPLTDLDEIEYAIGDVVWAIEPLTSTKRRGVIVSPSRVKFSDGTMGYYPRHRLRPYSAIDQLADLIVCETCGFRPADCECMKFTITEAASNTLEPFTYTLGAVATNSDPITALGDLVRSKREPLSAREKVRKRRRRLLAQRSRRRNRLG
jgi:hypothetical protein